MRVWTVGILVAVIALGAAITSSASADGPAGTDPSSNFALGPLPPPCWSVPTGAACIGAAVGYLDQARASLGQPAYVLPADFASLSPAQQVFVLANLDRIQYGLPAVPGLTQALNEDAARGVLTDDDPQPSDATWVAYTSNWAGGYQNVVLAYEGWMYDDGPGSGNLDCTAADPGGCWGHRHDILWRFGGGGALAMGVAAGADPSGTPGAAMLVEQQGQGVQPAYAYTWAQAVADGAGGAAAEGTVSTATPSALRPSSAGTRGTAATHSTAPPAAHAAAASIRIERVRVRGGRVTVMVFAPRLSALRCALTGRGRHGRRIRRAKRCGQQVTFSHLPAGSYRVRVTSPLGTVARRFRVR